MVLQYLHDFMSNIIQYYILDEYYLEFAGDKDAVDEFRSKNNITSKIISVNNNIAYWIKE